MKNKYLHIGLGLVLSFLWTQILYAAVPEDFKAWENQGQWPEHIKYKADLKGGAVFFESDGMSIQLSHPEDLQHDKRVPEGRVRAHGLRIEYLNSSKQVELTGQKPAPEYRNYFLGQNPNHWKSNIPGYTEVKYSEIYPGISMLWENAEGHLKYSLEIPVPENYKQFRWKYKGADSVKINASGDLEVYTSFSTLTEKKPIAWQLHHGQKIPVEFQFRLLGDTVEFYTRETLSAWPLIIDPTLIFSTYTGSVADNFGFTATYDGQGNLYAGGRVYSAGYPVFGAYQNSFQGVYDVSISKFNSSGTQMIYSTYLGGADIEQPHSLVVNSQDELLVLGTTKSLNFPLASPVQSIAGGNYDLFISRFNAAGNQLLASTYLGGSQNDGYSNSSLDYNYGDEFRGEILTDATDHIFIASNTSSSNFPASANIYQSVLKGPQDGVVLKFSPDLQTLSWATYLGGDEADACYGIKTDPYGNVYVTGGTRSSNFPALPNAYRPVFAGQMDGFVTQLQSDGSQILASTYLGTAGSDQSYFIQIDQDQQVYLYGQSTGNMPVIASPQGAVYSNPGGKQFIFCLDSSLSQSIFATVFGSGRIGPDISPTAFLVDNCGSIYCSGWAAAFQGVANPSNVYLNSTGLPITPDALKATTDGTDFYLMILKKYAGSLIYGTFLGGNISREHVDGGTCRFSPDGIVYHAVCAGCGGNSDFPVTPGVVSSTNNSTNCNLAAFKLDFEPRASADFTYTLNSFCPPYEVQFQYQGILADQYSWHFGLGPADTSALKNPKFNYPLSGSFEVTLIAKEFTCMGMDTAVKTLDLQPVKFASTLLNFSPCNTEVQAEYTGLPVDSILWMNNAGDSIRSTGNTTLSFPGTGTYYLTTVAFAGNCTDTLTDTLTFASVPPADFSWEVDTCSRYANFYSGVSDSLPLIWDFGDGDISEEKNPRHAFPLIGKYKVRLQVKADSCSSVIEKEIDLAIPVEQFRFIPNVFTPNEDGLNEFFEPELKNPDNYELSIYDRWGNRVHYSTDYTSPWDGKIQGKPVSEGVYFYIMKSLNCLGENKQIQGNISILR